MKKFVRDHWRLKSKETNKLGHVRSHKHPLADPRLQISYQTLKLFFNPTITIVHYARLACYNIGQSVYVMRNTILKHTDTKSVNR